MTAPSNKIIDQENTLARLVRAASVFASPEQRAEFSQLCQTFAEVRHLVVCANDPKTPVGPVLTRLLSFLLPGLEVAPVEATPAEATPVLNSEPKRDLLPKLSQPTVFVVRGHGRFPYDMLRYDCCCPEDGTAVAGLELDVSDMRASESQREVRLLTWRRSGPTVGRWVSFGWDVEVL